MSHAFKFLLQNKRFMSHFLNTLPYTIKSPDYKDNTLPYYPRGSDPIQWARSNCVLKRSVTARPELSKNSKVWHCAILKCTKMLPNVTRYSILGTKQRLPFTFGFRSERLSI